MPFERNLLIEAGAGTGKTTRLVKAVLQALFIRFIPLEGIVALTFTNKAAGELKERVGAALEDVLRAESIDTLKKKPWWPSPEPALALTDLQKLAQEASGVLDRADISTIHSFAFALLKRFPLASGIDPEASIDDKGLRFDELFRREWPLWLSKELGDAPPREKLWLSLLSRLPLTEVRMAARRLADFEVPQDRLIQSDENLQSRLFSIHAEIRILSAAHTGSTKADDIARACEEVIGIAAHGVWEKLEDLSSDIISILDKKLGDSSKTWTDEDMDRLEQFVAIARNLRKRGDQVIGLLTEILAPFVLRFRQVLLAEGCLTHAALLYLSREIVKNNPEIRASVKRRVRFILIDEFQDTDPLQAELLLYLAEKADHHCQSWEEVKLEPGKLFIVGDPKQSIYRFRGADIAAYERIGKLLVDQGGLQETLEVNYRSQSQIIHVVNQAFERMIQHSPEISPPYVPVKPHHAHDPTHAVQNVDIWLADSGEKQSVEDAQATEAEHIARWIKEAKGKLTVHDPKENQRRPLLYRDVSLIFRTYSPMDRYIEALRKHDIPFAVESERYFFTTPEVTDFINLLRAADDPEDLLSLVGYLRGPMAGLTDEEILKRKNAGTLEESDPVRWLRSITARLQREPLADVLEHIFAQTYLMELAARSYHGDQTVANLLKLKRLLAGFAAEGVMTMGLLLDTLDEFFDDDKIEGESPLADESYNAVRLLTIHKAKGLEYPVVFLPSLHSELRAHKPEAFVYDWRTRKLGLKIAGFANLDKIELDGVTRKREAAEENRILYVAMTRARERLVLSGGLNLKANRSQTYLQRLLRSWDLSLESLKEGVIQLGDTQISVQRMKRVTPSPEDPKKVRDNLLQRIDSAAFAKIWRDRAARRQKAEETQLVTTPTSVTSHELQVRSAHKNDKDDSFSTPNRQLGTSALLGTLVHRFLEQWDFSCEKCSMPLKLRLVANAYFAQEGLLRVPFPDPKEGEITFKPDDPMHELAQVVDDAQKILADFIGGDAWEEIKTSEILGREVPFFYGNTPTMRGTIDILYRLPNGQVVIGDYKTGQTKQDYSAQGKTYEEAVRRALGLETTFKVISLREDNAITL